MFDIETEGGFDRIGVPRWTADATIEIDTIGGTLDGVIVRISLGLGGRPLMLDTIHACGWYHLFFPAPGVPLRPGAPTHEEWGFVAAPLPELAPGSRFVPIPVLADGHRQRTN